MKKIIIAIDGYSGCGKSSTAKAVANELGYSFIDTGAMYRATTVYFLDNYIKLTNPKEVETALENIKITFAFSEAEQRTNTILNGKSIEHRIRTMAVNEKVSQVAALKRVREDMVAQQQKMGKSKGVVMDGRDIGTNVFPEAELKIFMKSDMDVRVHRRQDELYQKGIRASREEIQANFEKRDHIDSTREENPLRQAEDAIVLDSTKFKFENQVTFVLEHFKRIINE